MLVSEYTVPAGNECILPSYIDALNFFSAKGWLGEIIFGIAETPTGDIMGWGIHHNGGSHIVSAFANTPNREILAFTPIDEGSRFVFRQHTYLLMDDEDLHLVIREVTALTNEIEIRGTMFAQGYEDINVHAVKMYEIGAANRYIAPAWYIELPEEAEENDSYMPMFFSDLPLLNDIPVNALNWEFMDPGDVFIHDKQVLQLYENDEVGLYINKLSPSFWAKNVKK